jgi:hypothetical protein
MMLGREFSLATYELHQVWGSVITATKLNASVTEENFLTGK